MSVIDHDAFRELWESGAGTDIISAQFRRPRQWVAVFAERIGLEPRVRNLVDKDKLREMWRKNVPAGEIAARFGVTERSVKRAAQVMGLPIQALSITMTEEQKAEFISDWESGMLCDDIGAKYGHGRKWAAVRAKELGLERRTDKNIVKEYCAKPEPEDRKPAEREMRNLPHPNWPATLDVRVFRTGGKYSALATLSEETGRPTRALLARWHVIGG